MCTNAHSLCWTSISANWITNWNENVFFFSLHKTKYLVCLYIFSRRDTQRECEEVVCWCDSIVVIISHLWAIWVLSVTTNSGNVNAFLLLFMFHVLYELDCYKNIHKKAMIVMFINATKFWNGFIVLPHNEREVGNFFGNIMHNSNNSG